VQVVFGRRQSMHVISLLNHYAGMVISGEAVPHPQVGPVRVDVPVRVLGAAPKTVKDIDARGFRWRVERETVRMEADSIGHHALFVMEA